MNFRATSRFTGLNAAAAAQTYIAANRLSVEQSAAAVLEETLPLVAVDTGELRDSGHIEIEGSGANVKGYVVFDAEHAAFVEFGTGERGQASPGAGPGPYTPGWPGMVAQPYARPGLDSARPAIQAIFTENYSSATKLLGK